MPSSSILVVGSLNVDLTLEIDRFPAPGETQLSRGLTRAPGGKGANQAVAAARLGAPTSMIGCLGGDDAAELLLAELRGARVDVSAIARSDEPTGTALVFITASGENSILVAAGANAALTGEHLQAQRERIAAAGMVLTQLETPLPVLEELLRIAGETGVPVMLDPAPAMHLTQAVLTQLAWFTPNETEAHFYAAGEESGESAEPDGDEDWAEWAHRCCQRLQQLGPRNILLKLGGRGAAVLTEKDEWHLAAASRMDAVDTTGAGDILNAAFATRFLLGESVEQALRFAVAAASLSVTRPGAMRAAPDGAEVEKFLAGLGE